MGLDQYAKYQNGDGEQVGFFYWRKHANLQGWMEALYKKKGGKGEFNCESVELTASDLNKLKREYKKLDEATGFFWGHSQESDNEDVARFIELAKMHLSEGKKVFYSSWW